MALTLMQYWENHDIQIMEIIADIMMRIPGITNRQEYRMLKSEFFQYQLARHFPFAFEAKLGHYDLLYKPTEERISLKLQNRVFQRTSKTNADFCLTQPGTIQLKNFHCKHENGGEPLDFDYLLVIQPEQLQAKAHWPLAAGLVHLDHFRDKVERKNQQQLTVKLSNDEYDWFQEYEDVDFEEKKASIDAQLEEVGLAALHTMFDTWFGVA